MVIYEMSAQQGGHEMSYLYLAFQKEVVHGAHVV